MDVLRALNRDSSMSTDDIIHSVTSRPASRQLGVIEHIRHIQSIYQGPDRGYHNWSHIQLCIDTWWRLRSGFTSARMARAAFYALLYHDVVYDTHRSDNEQQSARYADAAMSRLGFRSDFIEDVMRLILATELGMVPQTEDEAIVKDIDVLYFYLRTYSARDTERGIRSEYRWVSDVPFRAGRRKILRQIYTRPIYSRLLYSDNIIAGMRMGICSAMGANAPNICVLGAFDIIHRGIQDTLYVASGYGPDSTITIGVLSDKFCSRHKPYHAVPERERMNEVMNSLMTIRSSVAGRVHPVIVDTDDYVKAFGIDALDVVVMCKTEASTRQAAIMNRCVEDGVPGPCFSTIHDVCDREGRVLSCTELRSGVRR